MAMSLDCSPATQSLKPFADPYSRFSTSRKLVITSIMGLGVLVVAIGMQCLLSALPQIASDLDTTQETINNCLAGYNVMLGVSPLLLSPMASYYGRPSALALCHVLFTAGSIGISLARTVPAFGGTLLLQAMGTIPAWSLGSAVVGDLHPPERRGRGLAVFYVLGTVGGAIAPTISGLFMEYTQAGWRGILYLLIGLSGTTLFLQLAFVPDTAHIASPYSLVGSRYAKQIETAQIESGTVKEKGRSSTFFPGWWSWEALNPWTCLRTLRNSRILMIAVYASVIQFGSFTLMVPLTVTLAPRFNITNHALIGALFLPIGFGDFLGGFLGGWISDRTLIFYRNRRRQHLPPMARSIAPTSDKTCRDDDSSMPEDRLRTMWIGGILLLPIALAGSGWCMQTGAGGIAPILILFILEGMAVVALLVPCNTYILDLAGDKGSEAMSAALCIRLLFSAGAYRLRGSSLSQSASILPLIQATSVGWANTISAGITAASYALVLLTIYLGDQKGPRARISE